MLPAVSEPEETPAVPTEEEPSRRKRAWGPDDSVVLFAITAIAAVSRFLRLGSPDKFAFDEVYYAKEACFYVKASEKLCDFPKSPPAEVHPPLAKWLMGWGIDIAGFDSFGWRVSSVVAGVLSVILLYLLARKLLGSTLAAGTAAGLLALDPLHFVHSRAALLDMYPTLFGVAAFLFLVYDRDRMIRETEGGVARGMFARPWRLAAGLAGGAATASKWSGGLVLAGVIVITLVWEIARRKELGWGQAILQTLRREGPSIVLYLGLAPFAFYVATYIGRLQGPVLNPLAEGSWLREWLRYQTNALTFHRNLTARHGYESPPAMWILIKRPLLYWAESGSQGKSSIYAMGNPLIWWPAIGAFAFLFVRWIKDRDWTKHRGLILGAFTATYLIWLVLAPRRDAVFLFYILPAIPYLCLAVAAVVTVELKDTARKVGVGVTALFAVGWFFAYYPIIANSAVPEERWDAQMFFQSCEKPTYRRTMTNTVTQAIDRNTTIIKTNERVNTDTKDIPPSGWCWK